jgi:preprotein translocase subunit SecE
MALGPFLKPKAGLKMAFKIKNFFVEARQELKHVNWPTRREAVRLTAVVIAISLAIAVFLGTFDFLFTYAIQNFIL